MYIIIAGLVVAVGMRMDMGVLEIFCGFATHALAFLPNCFGKPHATGVNGPRSSFVDIFTLNIHLVLVLVSSDAPTKVFYITYITLTIAHPNDSFTSPILLYQGVCLHLQSYHESSTI